MTDELPPHHGPNDPLLYRITAMAREHNLAVTPAMHEGDNEKGTSTFALITRSETPAPTAEQSHAAIRDYVQTANAALPEGQRATLAPHREGLHYLLTVPNTSRRAFTYVKQRSRELVRTKDAHKYEWCLTPSQSMGIAHVVGLGGVGGTHWKLHEIAGPDGNGAHDVTLEFRHDAHAPGTPGYQTAAEFVRDRAVEFNAVISRSLREHPVTTHTNHHIGVQWGAETPLRVQFHGVLKPGLEHLRHHTR